MPERLKKQFVRWSHSVPVRLGLLVTILMILSFSLLIYLNYRTFSREMKTLVSQSAENTSKLILRSTRLFMLTNNRKALQKTIEGIGDSPGIEGIWIYDKKGKIAYSNRQKDIGRTLNANARQCNFCHRANHPKTAMELKRKSLLLTTASRVRVMEVVNPIKNQKTCYTAACHAHKKQTKLLGLLSVQMNISGFDRQLTNMRNRTIAYTSILVLFAILLILWSIHHQVHAPFTSLYQATREVRAMNLDYRIRMDRKDEFGALARSFNRMLQTLDESNRQLQEWSRTLEQKVEEKTAVIKRAQKKILFMEKMASMGKLAAVVAHEVNNPLFGILSTAKLSIRMLARKQDEKTIQQVIENLELIASESKRCGDIIHNLLMFSKRGVIEVKKADLTEIARRSAAIVRHSFEMKKVELIEEYPDGPVVTDCVVDGIQQMLIALLINALDAVQPDDGEVRLVVKKAPENGPCAAQIEVIDNGCGMSEELKHKIFEPFFTTKTKDGGQSGTGLGLAVVYGVVTRHGGKIHVESKPGQGARFVVNLPDIPPAGLHKPVEVPIEELHSYETGRSRNADPKDKGEQT